MYYRLLFISFLFLSNWLTAQLDSLVIDSIYITGKSLEEEVLAFGAHSALWNDSTSVNSLAEALSASSKVYVKTNGPGLLATSSIRGASAAQTAVLWNGLNIDSPMLGLLDWAQLSSSMIDEASLSLGGASDIFGSGALVGVISLKSTVDKVSKLKVRVAIEHGSFGLKNYNVKVSQHYGKWNFKTKAHFGLAINDFNYLLSNGVQKRQLHGALSQNALMHSLSYKHSSSHVFTAHFWLQDYYKELPPRINQTESKSSQKDLAFRSIITNHNIQDNYTVKTKLAYFKEEIDFRDSLVGQYAKSDFYTLQFRSALDYHFNSGHKALITISNNYTSAYAEGYGQNNDENRLALSAIYAYQNRKLKIHLGLRNELIDQVQGPIIPSLRTSLALTDDLNIYGSLSRNYRYPTLNDRYWVPGGNEDLKPEIGWSYELGYNLDFNFVKGLKTNWSSSVYYREIENWIFWAPSQGQPFWQATNLVNVVSKGIESNLRFNYDAKLNYQLDLGTSILRSESQEESEIPKLAIGQQLYYVPTNIWRMSLKLSHKYFGLSTSQKYLSQIAGLSESIDSYLITDFEIFSKVNYGSLNSKLYLRLENAFDQRYQVVEDRPMPGRNFKLGVIVNY